MNKKILILAFAFVFLVAAVGNVSAFGVASTYSKDIPYGAYPGERTTIDFWLQNMNGDGDITVKVKMKDDAGIATVEEKDYLVPLNTKTTTVPVSLHIPADAPIGATYLVTMNFGAAGSGAAGGAVAFGTSMDVSFKVNVAAKPEAAKPQLKMPSTKVLIAVVILIVLVVIVWWYLKKRKTSSGVKRK